MDPPAIPDGPAGRADQAAGFGSWRWSRRGFELRGSLPQGEVRTAILLLLAERPMHGYRMIQELEVRTGGLWRPSSGSVYPALRRLRDEGLIVAHEKHANRLFSLTERGRVEVERHATARPPWQEITERLDPAVVELHNAVGQLGVVVLQLVRAGTEEQQVRALELLVAARRRLYRVLADDR